MMTDDAGAKERLETAVQRLEQALSRVTDKGSGGAADMDRLRQELDGREQELVAVRTERDRLVEELAQTKADGLALQTAMDAVSSRLDGAIDAVHALLDE